MWGSTVVSSPYGPMHSPVTKWLLCILSPKIASGCNNLPNTVSDWQYFFTGKKLPCATGERCISLILLLVPPLSAVTSMGMSGMPAAKIRAGKTKVFKEKYFGF